MAGYRQAIPDDLDLNLLRVLDAVLEERSVTRAAERLHLSQSAVSHALGRLRTALGDPLVVRHGGTMRPTAEGRRLEPEVRELMRLLRTTVVPRPFDPATTRRRFSLALPDALATTVGVPLLRHLAAVAPGAALEMHRLGAGTTADLASGALDAAVSVPGRLGPAVRATPLREVVWQAVVAPDHPLAGRHRLELADLASWPRAVVADAPADDAVSTALALHGQRAEVGVVVTSAALLPDVVAATRFVGVVAAGPDDGRVRRIALTPDVAPTPHHLHWSPATEGEPDRAWFLSAVLDVGGGET